MLIKCQYPVPSLVIHTSILQAMSMKNEIHDSQYYIPSYINQLTCLDSNVLNMSCQIIQLCEYFVTNSTLHLS